MSAGVTVVDAMLQPGVYVAVAEMGDGRVLKAKPFVYGAQNEAYKEVDGEKRRKALPVKELCVMAASGRAKRNVYIGLHSV